MILDVLAAAGIATSGAEGCEADDDRDARLRRGRRSGGGGQRRPGPVAGGGRRSGACARAVRGPRAGQGRNDGTCRGGRSTGVPVDRAGVAYAEMSMLRGDPSDGLPGVTGIGEKTAAKLITAFGNLDALEKAALEGDSSVPTRSRNALAAATDYLAAARVVVAVRTTPTPSTQAIRTYCHTPADPDRLAELGEELRIGASLGRLEGARLARIRTTETCPRPSARARHLVLAVVVDDGDGHPAPGRRP